MKILIAALLVSLSFSVLADGRGKFKRERTYEPGPTLLGMGYGSVDYAAVGTSDLAFSSLDVRVSHGVSKYIWLEGRTRLNVPMRNFAPFQKAFGCKKGQHMVAEKPVTFW